MTHYMIRVQRDGLISVGTDECEALATFKAGTCGALGITNFKIGCITCGDTYDVIDADGNVVASDAE